MKSPPKGNGVCTTPSQTLNYLNSAKFPRIALRCKSIRYRSFAAARKRSRKRAHCCASFSANWQRSKRNYIPPLTARRLHRRYCVGCGYRVTNANCGGYTGSGVNRRLYCENCCDEIEGAQ